MTDDKDTMRLMKPPRNEEEAEAMLAAAREFGDQLRESRERQKLLDEAREKYESDQ